MASTFTTAHDWELSATGLWRLSRLDLDGDGSWSSAGEFVETNPTTGGSPHFTPANEMVTRGVNAAGGGTVDANRTYADAGHLLNDGVAFKYVYDAFGRLRRVLDRSDDSLVAEYTYNGLGQRITEHADVTDDGTLNEPDGVVDADDPVFHLIHSDRWQHVETWREVVRWEELVAPHPSPLRVATLSPFARGEGGGRAPTALVHKVRRCRWRGEHRARGPRLVAREGERSRAPSAEAAFGGTGE